MHRVHFLSVFHDQDVAIASYDWLYNSYRCKRVYKPL